MPIRGGVYRFLSEESNWKKWWPGGAPGNVNSKPVFVSGGYSFTKTNQLFNAFEISIGTRKTMERSFLHIVPINNDSIKLVWTTTINTGTHPFSRISKYYTAKHLRTTLEDILSALQRHIGNVKHVYGIDIRKEKVSMEYLVSTSKTFSRYPVAGDIYAMFEKIKEHIPKGEVQEDNYPIFHITGSDSTQYEVLAAIPVTKQITDFDGFTSRRMLKNGNILVAEVTGGTATVDAAMKQMALFASDYHYNSIALPFQSYITNRLQVTDSSKWLTRISYPIL